ncbi:MAG: hypothetical protein H0T44_08760 [Gemmatimonadales bacterium]|nr:hypothetical protein [Gemmatimonadales bacterium]
MRRGPLWLWGLLLAGSGCHPQQRPAAQEACAPVTSELSPGDSAGALAGEYRLRLVATSGAAKDSATEGRLRLRPYLGLPRGTTSGHPLFGEAEIELGLVGAVEPGDIASDDPEAPGVLAIRRLPRGGERAPAEIMLRLGSEANRRGVRRFDGGYTVLQLREITDRGFAGSWRSGAPQPRSGGFFCAWRSAP